MPYAAEGSRIRVLFAIAILVSLGMTLAAASPQPAQPAQIQLAWRAPSRTANWLGSSTVNENVAFQMSSVLRAMAGHRADPVYVIEDRSRTYSAGEGAGQVYVDDVYTRRHGGPHNTDTTVKRRARKQIVAFDPSGKLSVEPFFCRNEPPLDDANADPKTYTQCAANQTPEQQRYEDPGDAALAEMPPGPVKVGSTWTFTRQVAVGREFASGSMTFVDTLQRVIESGNDRIAVIDVSGTGRIDVPKDLQARGFHTSTMTFGGTGQFNLAAGTPGAQHYNGHVDWHTSFLGATIGVVFDETYDGKAWTAAAKR